MEKRISRELVENQHGTDRPRDGFLGTHNGVVARGPAKEGSDRKRVVWPISSGSPPGDDNKASEDGIKRVPTGRAKDVNFSHFLRPALFKVNKPRCGGLPELGCSSGLVGKDWVTGDQHQTCGPEQKADISPDADPSGNLCPDKRFSEPSSSILASNLEGKRARGVELTRVSAMPMCSHSASNEPKVYPKRRYEDCQSSSQSDRDNEDSGRFDGAAGTKERRSSAHRPSERSRRGRINKKLRSLQELLPNCDKVDQAGVLDKAIEYLKTLQQQLLVLSSGSPMYLSPPMMLPAVIQQIYASYRTQIPTFNVPRGMSLGLQFQTRTAALGLQPVPPFVPSSLGRSSSPSLSLDSSLPTDTVDDLVDSAYQSGSSGDDQS